ncbi:hypothetical protein [Sinorhizobium fredii]|uniref:Uncharacterized protein n=1 Tax=Sinorhizobium fredii (strain HH103) TaxID=1117943 RepID=G9AA74_SINF1|nr:hypothetical protein [Sinorhizobium fredii]AWM23467.1 hypothetical protein AOX55_0000182 [Sinorhizobium fredii CCBAU 25509]CCE94665.1 hypothetical protein SFHH103_00161 [Sinorhizobium fredii HH103]
MTENTLNPFANPEQRLAKLSMAELSSLYDAVDLARQTLAGIVNQPRFFRGEEYNGAGDEVEGLIDALIEFAGAAVEVAKTASPADPAAVEERAWLLLKYSVTCGDCLTAHAAEGAGYAAQLAMLKQLKQEK